MVNEHLKNKRIIYYDYIRAFAIFGVIACHIFAGFVVNKDIFGTNLWYYSIFLNSLRDVSVPLFVCVSGALLITKKDSIAVFIKKRLNKVLIPYFFWVIMFILIEIFCYGKNNNPKQFIINVFSIPPEGSAVVFWFVQMILVVYIVIIILNKLIQYKESFLKLSLLVSVIVAVLINFNLIPMNTLERYLYYSIFAIFGFYLSSYDFTENKIVKLSKEKLAVLFLILSIILYLLEIYFNITTSIKLNNYHSVNQFGFLNISLVISAFLFFRYFSESKGKLNKLFNYIQKSKIGKMILSIGLCSYGIYLSHIIIRDGLQMLKFKSISPSILFTIYLFITLISSWLIILLMSKVPILNKVCGKS